MLYVKAVTCESCYHMIGNFYLLTAKCGFYENWWPIYLFHVRKMLKLSATISIRTMYKKPGQVKKKDGWIDFVLLSNYGYWLNQNYRRVIINIALCVVVIVIAVVVVVVVITIMATTSFFFYFLLFFVFFNEVG